MQTASDSAIWNYALEAAAAIITKDEDFAQRRSSRGSRRCCRDILSALERGETLVEVV
jgi:predicted nuclease of predicted toxin-antitoxin system